MSVEDSRPRARRAYSSAAEVPVQDMTYTSFGSTVASGSTIPPPRPPTAIGAAPNPDPPKQPEEMAPTPGGASVVAVPANTTAVTATAWPPIAIALLRGAIEGLILAGLDALTALQFDYSGRDALVSAGMVFFGRLAIALGVGQMDQANSKRV